MSYADTAFGHVGYIYQATNWIYTGEATAHDCEFIINGKRVHSRTLTGKGITAPNEWAKENGIERIKPKPKHRYFYFIGSKKEKKEMRKKLPYEIKAYPKGDTNRTTFTNEISINEVLF